MINARARLIDDVDRVIAKVCGEQEFAMLVEADAAWVCPDLKRVNDLQSLFIDDAQETALFRRISARHHNPTFAGLERAIP